MAQVGKVAALVGQRSIAVYEFPVPDVDDESILLGVGLTGVCGSDLHRYQDVGEKLDLALPVVMGHEITGRALKMGRRANEVMKADQPLREGDRVVVYAQRPCGQCHWCREFGHTARCVGPRPTGYGYRYGSVDAPPYFTGGFGDYLLLGPGTWIWRIPDDVPWEAAALAEPLSMGIRAVERALSLPSWKNEQTLTFGGSVAILGAGAIGVLTAAAARLAGAGQVILVGAPRGALEVAQRAGVADVTIDIDQVGPAERIERVRALTPGGYGADVVFEAAGVPVAFLEGLEMLRPLGTYVELGCMIDTGKTVPLNVARHLTQKDLILYTVAAQPAQTIGKAVRTIAATHQRIDYPSFVGQVLPIAETGQAFPLLEHPAAKPIKVAVRGAGY
ncbi:MAG: alcohol dehydrogenase catalytic domain-containing protein [Chloroflexi bacterium]|nr:alcohol dehydrogenase catalytic domain-containing protein [Chloroflexota bacterium]